MFWRCWMSFVLLSALNTSASADPEAEAYRWVDVGAGVYVSTQSNPFRGPVDGNCVVIVTDRDVVVVDTHINPAAARKVVRRIREITEKPVTWVVNTHWHDDHTNGNETFRDAFPGATIVAHRATYEALRSKWQDFEDGRLAAYQRAANVDLEAEARKAEANDPNRAAMLRVYKEYRDALLPELPELDLVYPSVTFDSTLRLVRGERTVEIMHLGVGNTAGDAVVWLPEDRILISGDMVVHPIPYAYEVSFTEWVETLGRVIAMKPRVLIPGHGSVQNGTEYVERLIRLFNDTVSEVEAAAEDGADWESVQSEVRLDTQAAAFAGDDPDALFAFETYYRDPAIKSLWATLHPDSSNTIEQNDATRAR